MLTDGLSGTPFWGLLQITAAGAYFRLSGKKQTFKARNGPETVNS